MMDLFSYPAAPGHRGVDTSIAAADSVGRCALALREQCMARLRIGPATADEVAGYLGASVLAIRPRFTELAQAGLIVDTGERRRNDSGRMAKVWRLG